MIFFTISLTLITHLPARWTSGVLALTTMRRGGGDGVVAMIRHRRMVLLSHQRQGQQEDE
jgi:hypothetical protein